MREDGQRICSILGKTPGAERILLWDDLEGLYKWKRLDGWGGPSGQKFGSVAFNGSYSLLQVVFRDLPDSFWYNGLARSFPMVKDGVLRVEAVAMLPALGGLNGFGVAVVWYDGECRYEVGAVYEDVADYFVYWSDRGRWADSGLARFGRAADAWHRVWLEVDLVRKEYVNAGMDGDTVQLDGNKICAVADAGPVVAYVILVVPVYEAGFRKAYFDDVLCRSV